MVTIDAEAKTLSANLSDDEWAKAKPRGNSRSRTRRAGGWRNTRRLFVESNQKRLAIGVRQTNRIHVRVHYRWLRPSIANPGDALHDFARRVVAYPRDSCRRPQSHLIRDNDSKFDNDVADE